MWQKESLLFGAEWNFPKAVSGALQELDAFFRSLDVYCTFGKNHDIIYKDLFLEGGAQ